MPVIPNHAGEEQSDYKTAWDDSLVPYLSSVADAWHEFPSANSETTARNWVLGRPKAYCNCADPVILREHPALF